VKSVLMDASYSATLLVVHQYVPYDLHAVVLILMYLS